MMCTLRMLPFLFFIIFQSIPTPCYARENTQTQFWIQVEEGSPYIIKQKQLEKFLNQKQVDSILLVSLTDSLKKRILKHDEHAIVEAGHFITKFQTITLTQNNGDAVELKIPDKKMQSPNMMFLFIYNWEINYTEPGSDLILPTSESVTFIPGNMASISQKGNFVLVNMHTQEILHYGKFNDKWNIHPQEKNTILNKLIHQVTRKILDNNL